MIGTDLISRAGALLAPVLPRRNVIVITDETVRPLYLPRLLASFQETGIEARSITVAPGEHTKCWATYQNVVDTILEGGVERRTAIIALGGGVVGDLAGFVAATTLRGLPFIQIPPHYSRRSIPPLAAKRASTRAGARSDRRFPSASMRAGGCFLARHPPPREVVAGYAEIVKSGLIGQESLFAWCEKHGAAVLSRDPEALAEAVRQACAFKAGVVAADEREEQKTDGRALLNLGHTFGHALEAELGYDGRLLHGEAVSIGLTLAFSLSVKLGFCPQEDLIRVTNHLESLHMPAHISDLPHRFRITDLMTHMQRDKKMQDGRLSFVLAHGIGKAFTTRDVPAEAVREVLLADGATP